MKFPKKRFHVKAAVWLCAILGVLAVGVHFLHGYQVRSNAGILLAQAEKAEAAGQVQKTVEYLRRYLGLAPKDTDAMVKLGTLLSGPQLGRSQRNVVQAFLILDQVLRLDPGRSATRRQIIHLALDSRLQRFNDALAHLTALTEAEGKSSESLSWEARCQLGLRKHAEARRLLEEALTLPGCPWEEYLRLAFLLQMENAHVRQPKQGGAGLEAAEDVRARAGEVITAMLKAHEKTHLAHLAAADYVRRFNPHSTPPANQQAAAKHIEDARVLAPDALEVILAHAGVLEEQGQKEPARTELERGLKLHDQSFNMYQALAQFELRSERPGTALAVLNQGLEKLPGNLDLQWNLAHLLIQEGKAAEANQVIERLGKQGFPKAELDYLRGRVHVRQEDWAMAMPFLERATTTLGARANEIKDWLSVNLLEESTLLLAKCQEKLGDADAAGAAYNRVVARNPQSIEGRFGLARMEWTMGRYDAAAREYRVLMQAPKPNSAWIECARVLIERNHKTDQPNWIEVEVLLDQAERRLKKPLPVQVPLLRAETLAGKKFPAKAAGYLTQSFPDKKTRPVEIWVGLANLEQRQGQWEAAVKTLVEAEAFHGDRLELRLARARLWGRRGGQDAGPALEQLGQGMDKFQAEEQRRLWRVIAESYLANGQAKKARAVWLRLLTQFPKDIGGRLALFDLALREKDDSAMEALIRDIKGVDDDRGTLWQFAQSSQWISQYYQDKDLKKLDAAEEYLVHVRKHRPNWGRVWLALGEIKDLRQEDDGALEDYTTAMKLGEQNPAGIRRMVQLLAKWGRYQEAEDLLHRLRAQTSLLGDLDRVEAEIALMFHNNGELALKLALKAVAPESKNYKDQLWLGQIFSATGRPSEAEARFRQAIELAPEIPDVWVTYVAFQKRTFKDDKDLKAKITATIQEAEKRLPAGKGTFALAYCHEMIGNKEKARALYQAAVDANANDAAALMNLAIHHLRHGQKEEAQKRFQQILELKDMTPAQRADANRALVLITASGNNYQETIKALEKLEFLRPAKEGADTKTALADVRARIAVLASRNNLRDRKKAVDLMEDLLRRRLLSNEDRYVLAKLYEAIGDWSKAGEQFLFVLTEAENRLGGKNPDKALLTKYQDRLADFCAGLLRDGQLNRAELYLAKLGNLAPKAFRTVALRAQLLAKKGRAEEAVPPLLALAKDDPKLLRPTALVLEQMGQLKVAEELLRQHLANAKGPEAQLALAAYLGRQKRPDEALDLCEQALQGGKVESAAGVAVGVLHLSKKVTDEQCRRVAAWIQKGIDLGEKPAVLTAHLAVIHLLRKDYERCLATYGQLIKEGVNEPLLLNNYAWLLAVTGRSNGEALKVIDRAIEQAGPAGELLDTRAVVYLAMKDAKRALEDLKEAVAEKPTAIRYFHLAQAHHLAGNRRDAADAFARGRQLNLSEETVDPLELAGYHQLRAGLEGNTPSNR